MTAIVTIETVALLLLALLVVGLLRSHAEILRRLDLAEASPAAAASSRRGSPAPARTLRGRPTLPGRRRPATPSRWRSPVPAAPPCSPS